MAAITATGSGSGIDIELLVEKLTQAEREPVENRLNLRQVQIEADVSAYKTFKTALADLKASLSGLTTLTGFAQRTATSANEDIFTASASSSAVPGTTAIKVTQLASAHKLVSGNFTDGDSAVGQGDLNISVGADSFTVKIDSSNNTLSGIRDAINDAADNTGVTASILTVDDLANPGSTVSKLVLTSDNSGEDSALTITVANDADSDNTNNAGLSQLVYDTVGGVTNLTQLTPAKDALIEVDGFQASSSTNTFTGVLPGVTINAASVDLDNTYNLTVALDKSAVKEKINELVKALNAYKTTYDFLTEVDLDSKESGLLTGDSTARTINNQINSALGSVVSEGTGVYSTLAAIGIERTREGEFSLNEEVLNTALNSSFDEVSELVAGENGVAGMLKGKLDSFLQSGGVISSVNNTFDTQLKDIEEQRAALDRRIDSVEKRLRQQFTNMDIIVAQFNNTGDFLTQQLDAIAPKSDK